MKRKLLIPVVLCLTSLGWGQPAAPSDHLKPILWMAGNWEGVEKGSDGTLKVLLTVTLSENGQALLYKAAFAKGGKIIPKYQGMYYWDPEGKGIAMMQISDEGNVAHGTYSPAGESEADQLVKVVSSGSTFELKSHYNLERDGFHFAGQFRPAGKQEWVPAVEVDYKRIDGPAAGKK